MGIIGGRLVLTVLENAYSRVMIHATDGKPLDEIKLPTLGTVGASAAGRTETACSSRSSHSHIRRPCSAMT